MGRRLKTDERYFLSHGMRKRSQIDSINGEDISNLPLKRILSILSKVECPFLCSFMIPEQSVETVEIFFRGKFVGDYVEFSCDENDQNYIISSIDHSNKEAVKLMERTKIKTGYRVIKVKGIKVINKKYCDIQKMITSASNDLRIDYGVLFEEGDLDWYNLKKPKNSNHLNSKTQHLRHSKSVANIGNTQFINSKKEKRKITKHFGQKTAQKTYQKNKIIRFRVE